MTPPAPLRITPQGVHLQPGEAGSVVTWTRAVQWLLSGTN
jgi:hypothetical protein